MKRQHPYVVHVPLQWLKKLDPKGNSLGPTGALLLAYFAKLEKASREPDGSFTFGSYEREGLEWWGLDVSTSTTTRAVKWLVDVGWIKTERRGYPAQRWLRLTNLPRA